MSPPSATARRSIATTPATRRRECLGQEVEAARVGGEPVDAEREGRRGRAETVGAQRSSRDSNQSQYATSGEVGMCVCYIAMWRRYARATLHTTQEPAWGEARCVAELASERHPRRPGLSSSQNVPSYFWGTECLLECGWACSRTRSHEGYGTCSFETNAPRVHSDLCVGAARMPQGRTADRAHRWRDGTLCGHGP